MNKKRIEQLKDEILKDTQNLTYAYLILRILNRGTLDKLTSKITNTKTKVNVTTITNKNYLSGNEQFLSLLNNFIYHFKEDFYFLQSNFENIIEILLQNEKHNKYLLCKKYIGNNNYISYFSNNIKRLTVSGFYNNLKKLSKKSELIKKFMKDNHINSRICLISNPSELETLYNLLKKISICNAKTSNNIMLFQDIKYYLNQTSNNINKEKLENNIYNYYIKEWELMINNYYEKIDAINILLK